MVLFGCQVGRRINSFQKTERAGYGGFLSSYVILEGGVTNEIITVSGLH